MRTGSAAPGASASPGSGAGSVGPLPSVNLPTTPVSASIPRDGRTLGASTAPVTLDLWEDFQCPGCGNFSRAVEPIVIERYVAPGNLRVTFHDVAFLGQESQDAASAARCADQQGKFWEYQSIVYANQNGENEGWFTRDRLEAFAAAAGVDTAAWATCYDGGGQRQAVVDETKAGADAGVSSTPTLALNGQLVPIDTLSSWNDLYPLIDKAIAAAGSSGSSVSPPSTTP